MTLDAAKYVLNELQDVQGNIQDDYADLKRPGVVCVTHLYDGPFDRLGRFLTCVVCGYTRPRTDTKTWSGIELHRSEVTVNAPLHVGWWRPKATDTPSLLGADISLLVQGRVPEGRVTVTIPLTYEELRRLRNEIDNALLCSEQDSEHELGGISTIRLWKVP